MGRKVKIFTQLEEWKSCIFCLIKKAAQQLQKFLGQYIKIKWNQGLVTLMIGWKVMFLVHMIKYSSTGHWGEIVSFESRVFGSKIAIPETQSQKQRLFMHTERLALQNVYAAVYKETKGKIQHLNALATLLCPWNSNSFLSLAEHKTRGVESSLTQNIPYLFAVLLSWYVALKSFTQREDLIYFSSWFLFVSFSYWVI